MKKQINPTIKAHLIRGAFYLILLLAVCAIPFALAARNTAKRSVLKPLTALNPARVYAPQTQFPASRADNALNHFAGGKQAQRASVFRFQPLGLDCDNAPGIVIQDDGTIEDGYSGNPGAGVTEVRVVDKFTPTSYPSTYSSVCLDFVTLAGGPPTYNVDIVVYDDDGAGGSPGTLLGSLNAQSATTHVFSPGQTPIWNSYNISGLGLNITSGSVYIGARWMPPSPTNVYISSDESTGHPVGFAGGYFWDNIDNAWATTQSFFPAYRACMIRPVQGAAGPTPTGTPSPTPTATATPCVPTYTTATATGTITAGGTDIGNHCDDCFTQINLPFPVNVYGAPTSVAWPASNGDLHLADPILKSFYYMQCVPVDPSPDGPWTNTLFPFYDDLLTMDGPFQTCSDCGIFTQTLGTAPNRQFIIRWKTVYFNNAGTAEFEVILTEGSDTLSVIYGDTSGDNGLTAASGIQQDLNMFTSFSCMGDVPLTSGLRVDYIPTGCASPTPTPTATATATPTATMAPRPTPSPRPRPTPAPRP